MLLVDVGNTRVKWATWVDGVLSAQQGAAHGQWSVADWHSHLFGAHAATVRVLAASVAGEEQRENLRQAAALAGATVRFVQSTPHVAGVRNAYPDPALLGVDRWVAVIGAYHLRRTACCIVDVGTAATVDAVDEHGSHLGGFIVPGPHILVHSLLRGTSDLAAHAARSVAAPGAFFATNTHDAIERGCRIALAALVDRAYVELSTRLGAPPILLGTGGALGEITPFLLTRIELVPDLVLRGLGTLAALAREAA